MSNDKPNLKTIKAIIRVMQESDIAELSFGDLHIKMQPMDIVKHKPIPEPKALSSKDVLDRHVAKEKQIVNIDEIIDNDPNFYNWQVNGGTFNRGN